MEFFSKASSVASCDHVFYYYRAPSPGGLKSCKYFASLFIFRPQAGLNTASNGFKRLHQGLKNVRSAYESHISRPQPHGLKTAATWLSMRGLVSKGSEGGFRAGPEAVKGGSRGGLDRSRGGPGSKSVWGRSNAYCEASQHRLQPTRSGLTCSFT